jgi:Mce-associated membrane protein
MAEAKNPDSATSKADTLALIAEAEAEAAEAEALAAAARARARAARLRREVQAEGEAEAEAEAEAETAETTEEVPDAVEHAPDTDLTDAAETDSDATDAGESEEEEEEEEVSDEAPEDAESDSESVRSRRRLRLPSLSVAWKAAAIILICAFIAASAYMMWQRHEITERNQNITSLDFNRAKEDVQRVIDSSTGQFRDDFQQRAKDFTTVVEQSKVVTEGTVTAAALQSIDGNSALVLVAATSRITNAAGAKDEPRRWRLRVTVTEEGGQYKVSKLEFIP